MHVRFSEHMQRHGAEYREEGASNLQQRAGEGLRLRCELADARAWRRIAFEIGARTGGLAPLGGLAHPGQSCAPPAVLRASGSPGNLAHSEQPLEPCLWEPRAFGSLVHGGTRFPSIGVQPEPCAKSYFFAVNDRSEGILAAFGAFRRRCRMAVWQEGFGRCCELVFLVLCMGHFPCSSGGFLQIGSFRRKIALWRAAWPVRHRA